MVSGCFLLHTPGVTFHSWMSCYMVLRVVSTCHTLALTTPLEAHHPIEWDLAPWLLLIKHIHISVRTHAEINVKGPELASVSLMCVKHHCSHICLSTLRAPEGLKSTPTRIGSNHRSCSSLLPMNFLFEGEPWGNVHVIGQSVSCDTKVLFFFLGVWENGREVVNSNYIILPLTSPPQSQTQFVFLCAIHMTNNNHHRLWSEEPASLNYDQIAHRISKKHKNTPCRPTHQLSRCFSFPL